MKNNTCNKAEGFEENQSNDKKSDRFGLSTKSMWSIRFVFNLIPWCILGAFLLFLVFSCFYTVDSQQTAILFHFGKFTKIVEPGLHVKLPYPIQSVEYFDTERIMSMYVGQTSQDLNTDFLWDNAHAGCEEAMLLGNGNELCAVNMRLNYKINDVEDYRKNYKASDSLLSARAYECLLERTISTDLDTLLSVDREAFAISIQAELNEFSSQKALGLEVVDVIIENIHPAIDAVPTYQKVINASIDRNSYKLQAQGYRTEKISAAVTYKESEVNKAIANQKTRLAEATQTVSVFLASAESWQANPESVEFMKTLNAYKHLIKDSKLYVFSPNTIAESDKFLLRTDSRSITVK